MNQILQILRKDMRRHWPETVASMLLLAAFVWREPGEWGLWERAPNASEYLLQFVGPLLVISWGFLILRVIHEESLVGDRQFWVTRPYEWKKLLAAKVLFFVIFVNVPLFVAQVVLLKEGSFGIGSNLLNLMRMHLADWSFLLIAIVLAAITRGLGQAVLVGIGAAVAAIGAGALVSQIPASSMGPVAPIWDALEGWVYLAASLVVIWWQYARRSTLRSRALLMATAALAFLVQLITPYNKLIDEQYPAKDESRQPVRIAFAVMEPRAKKPGTQDWPLREWPIRVPLRLSGMASDRVVSVKGIRVVVEGTAGIRWDSGWQAGGPELWPDESLSYVNFQMKSEQYDKLKAIPLKLRMTLALAEMMETNVQEIALGNGEIAIPNVGTCWNRPGLAWIQCRAAVRRQGAMASVAGAIGSCARGPSEGNPVNAKILHALLWAPQPDVNAGISPVQTFTLTFSPSSGLLASPEDQGKIVICPETPMRLAKPKIVGQSRIEFETPEIRLEEYRVNF
jgi:hypothetical protein